MIKKLFVLIAISFLFSRVYGQPSGMDVTAGNATKQITGNTLQINADNNTVINWNDFSISKGEITKFVMPSSSSAVLNRVVGNTQSNILGSLLSNGKIYLINPSGIIIGKDAIINTSSFIASTFDLLNEEFLKGGDLLFSGDSKEKIINLGKIQATDGDAILIARQIENKGSIEATNGVAAIGAGKEILLKPCDKQRILIKPAYDENEEDKIGIDNSGEIKAKSSYLKSDGYLYSLAINISGKIDALSIEEKDGEIFLFAEGGKIDNSGVLTAKKKDNGGEVKIFGDYVGLTDDAIINVSAERNGGTVLLGKDITDINSELNPSENFIVYIGEKAKINADSTDIGQGGKVILWSDNSTYFFGSISACGGKKQGDGGFAEVSGGDLFYEGIVDLMATNGSKGKLLLDPYNITISSSYYNKSISFDEATYTPVGNDAILNSSTLQKALSSADVTVSTTSTKGGGSQSGNIYVNSSLNLNGNLSLIADNNIYINQAIHTSKKDGKDFCCQAFGDINITDTISCKNIYLKANGNINIFQDHNAYPLLKVIDGKITLDSNTITMKGGDNSYYPSNIVSLGSSQVKITTRSKNRWNNKDGNFLIEGKTSGAAIILSDASSFYADICKDFHIDGRNGPAYIQVENDILPSHVDINIKCRDLTLSAGNYTDNNNISSGIVIKNGDSSSINIEASRNILLSGSENSIYPASIASLSDCSSSKINIKAKDNLVLTGVGDCCSFIAALDNDHSGTINLYDTSSISLNGGENRGNAYIKSEGEIKTNKIGSINLSVEQGYDSKTYISSYGNMQMEEVDNISLINKGNNKVFIKTTNGGNISINSKKYFGKKGISINDASCTGTAFIATEEGGNIECYFNGSSSLYAGTGKRADGGIFSAYSHGEGNVFFQSGDLTISGGSDINSFAGIRAGYSSTARDGNLEFHVGDLKVIAGDKGYAAIGARGSILNSSSKSMLLESNEGNAYMASEKTIYMDAVGPLTMVANSSSDVSIVTMSSTGKEISLLGVTSIDMLPKGNDTYIKSTGGGFITINNASNPGKEGVNLNPTLFPYASYIATNSGGDITCHFLGNSSFNGGSEINTSSGIFTGLKENGGNIIFACNDLVINGGASKGTSLAGIYTGYEKGMFSGYGDINLSTYHLSLTGGSGSNDINIHNAEIRSGYSKGKIDVDAKGYITLTGGKQSGGSAYIKTTKTGKDADINICSSGIYLNGGYFSGADAAIATCDNSIVNIIAATHDLHIKANNAFAYINNASDIYVTRDLLIQGSDSNTASAYIHTSPLAKDIKFHVGNNFYMISGGHSVEIQDRLNNATDITFDVGNDFMIIAKNSPATISGYNSYKINVGRNLTIKGGACPYAHAYIKGIDNIDLSAGALSIYGGDVDMASASIVSEKGDMKIDILKSSMGLFAKKGQGADAYISVADNKNISLDVIGCLNIISNEKAKAYIESGSFSSFNISQKLHMVGVDNPYHKDGYSCAIWKKGNEDFIINAGLDVHLCNAEIANANGNITIIAGTAIEAIGASAIHNMTDNDITLIVDNNYSSTITGHGRIVKSEDSIIETTTTAGKINIYTADREFNSIEGNINGMPYISDDTYIDNKGNELETPNPTTSYDGDSFTIYYKSVCSPSKVGLQAAALSGAELSYKLDDMKINFSILDYYDKMILRKKGYRVKYLFERYTDIEKFGKPKEYCSKLFLK